MLLFNLIILTIIFLVTVRLEKQTVEETGDIEKYHKYKRTGKILLSMTWGCYGLLHVLILILKLYVHYMG